MSEDRSEASSVENQSEAKIEKKGEGVEENSPMRTLSRLLQAQVAATLNTVGGADTVVVTLIQKDNAAVESFAVPAAGARANVIQLLNDAIHGLTTTVVNFIGKLASIGHTFADRAAKDGAETDGKKAGAVETKV